ncbi:MAG TPA: ABC transporter ATP-binding protein, partial [Treponemataceae bacterium]|nr:ABC transporter ATP-binding protein [Treponemataceae bacterium]
MSKIEIRELTKSYKLGHTSVEALRGISLTIDSPEIIGVVGPSGSGKSTMLNILGGIDVPTSGAVLIDGREIGKLDDDGRTALRRNEIGFIFQSFNLIPVLSALENVELPLMALGVGKKERRERARALLERVGLSREANQRPDELSGGQRQRVAVARALIIKPRLVLADEPTANLDGESGRNVLELMHEMNHELKTTFILSTHDPRVLPYLDRRMY